MAERPVPSSAAVSARMSRHPRRDTTPELALRRLLHAAGYRYRVCLPVPGMPRRTIDIAFTRMKIAIFIDGCFWHGCRDHRTVPRANNEWWIAKLERNRRRDEETTAHLEALGWTVLRFWEHTDPESALEAVNVAAVGAAIRRRELSTPHGHPPRLKSVDGSPARMFVALRDPST